LFVRLQTRSENAFQILEATMSARTVTIEQAQQQLAELVQEAAEGGDVVILAGDKSGVRLVPLRVTGGPRQFGGYRDLIDIADDFDDPLPAEFWLGDAVRKRSSIRMYFSG
jgi:antitoxin (DNA-binding transcriptional repressor) of toxin-antitoxin stability system